MNLVKMSIEDILKRIDIQTNIQKLQSGKRDEVLSALRTLASAAEFSNRKDCIMVLAGYYVLEVRSIDDLESFISATRLADSGELAHIVMKDIVRNRDISRRRLLIDDIVKIVRTISRKFGDEQIEALKQMIDSSVWGEKLKIRFHAIFRTEHMGSEY